jgi:hypothetical protein
MGRNCTGVSLAMLRSEGRSHRTIAGAVTEYVKHTPASNEGSSETLNPQREQLAQALLNHLHAASLAVTDIKTGSVGTGGPTMSVLEDSLTAMRNLIGHWLAEV